MFGVEVERVRPEVTNIVLRAGLFYHLNLDLEGERQKAARCLVVWRECLGLR